MGQKERDLPNLIMNDLINGNPFTLTINHGLNKGQVIYVMGFYTEHKGKRILNYEYEYEHFDTHNIIQHTSKIITDIKDLEVATLLLTSILEHFKLDNIQQDSKDFNETFISRYK